MLLIQKDNSNSLYGDIQESNNKKYRKKRNKKPISKNTCGL